MMNSNTGHVTNVQDIAFPNLSLRAPIIIGMSALSAMIVAISGWSSTIPLASAALATGTVVAESDRKVVQHVEGGIVKRVLVHDGDLVKSGQLLISLDDTRIKSTLATIRPMLLMNAAQVSRLRAERNGLDKASDNLSADQEAGPDYEAFRDEQESNRLARRKGMDARIAAQQIEQSQHLASLGALRRQLQACEQRSELNQQDVAAAQELALKGYGTLLRLRETQRRFAEVRSECINLSARIMDDQHKIDQTEIEIDRVHANFLESVEAELQQAEREHLDLGDRYRVALDQLNRASITAPVSGYIVNLVVHTEGGVVGPGMPLLEIVPDTDRMVIETQVIPSDAQSIKPGQLVKVRLSSDDGRQAPTVEGSVLSVSADRILDRQRSASFFLVRAIVDPEDVKRAGLRGLRPGLSVELMIHKGEKTLVDYLISPMFAFFSQAMHE